MTKKLLIGKAADYRSGGYNKLKVVNDLLVKNSMNNIFEKIALTAKLVKTFDIYFVCYLATNRKIAITHLLYAIELQTMDHLIAKDKIAGQQMLGSTLTAIVLELQRLCSIVRIL